MIRLGLVEISNVTLLLLPLHSCKSRGGKHIENCIDPQNTLVGPIWRCCGQKTRPPGHFWVPFRPNLVFALFTWENGPKLKFSQYSPKTGFLATTSPNGSYQSILGVNAVFNMFTPPFERDGITICHSFVGPVAHNIWWKNWWNGSFGPEMIQICKFRPQNHDIQASGWGVKTWT